MSDTGLSPTGTTRKTTPPRPADSGIIIIIADAGSSGGQEPAAVAAANESGHLSSSKRATADVATMTVSTDRCSPAMNVQPVRTLWCL